MAFVTCAAPLCLKPGAKPPPLTARPVGSSQQPHACRRPRGRCAAAVASAAHASLLHRVVGGAALAAVALQSAPPAVALQSAPPAVALPPPAVALPPPILDSDHAIVDEVFSLVRNYYVDPSYHGVDWEQLYDVLMSTTFRNHNDVYRAIRGSLRKLDDVYTRLLDPEAMERLRKYDVSGVGLLLTSNARGELVVASNPLPSSAAAKYGIRRGDVVVSVDGVSLAGRGAFDAAEMMQGDDGTTMTVGIKRGRASDGEAGDGDGVREVTLVRKFTDTGGAPVVSSLETVGGRNVGYVRLQDFSAGSRSEVEKALRSLDERGADAYVLDLRGNPGGVFEGALEIAGLFEGRGYVVARVASRSEREEAFRSRIIGDDEGSKSRKGVSNARNAAGKYENGAVVSQDAPLAILVDSGSASASEVLGGGLRDNCRGVIAGSTKSYGKGLIQGVFGLTDGGGIVVTVASYKTPAGDEIQGKGLQPTVPIANGLFEKVLRLGRHQGEAGVVNFDEVDRQIRLCRATASETAQRDVIFPSSPFGR